MAHWPWLPYPAAESNSSLRTGPLPALRFSWCKYGSRPCIHWTLAVAVCFIFFFPDQRSWMCWCIWPAVSQHSPVSFAYMQRESTCQVPFHLTCQVSVFTNVAHFCSIPLAGGREFHQAIAAAKRCRLRALAPPLPLGNFVGSYFAFCVSTLQKLQMEFVSNLVGGFNLPLWKMMEWKSVGKMKFPTEWKTIKLMFQTTNQQCL